MSTSIHEISAGVQLGLTLLATALTLQAARLAWKASYQRRDEQQQLRQWYDTKWQRLKDSPWLRLPEVVIGWLVKKRNSLAKPDIGWATDLAIVFSPLIITFILWTHADQSNPLYLQHPVTLIFIALLLYLTSLILTIARLTKLYIASLAALTTFGTYLWVFYCPDRGHRNAVLLSIAGSWLVCVGGDCMETWSERRGKEGDGLPPKIIMLALFSYLGIAALLLYAVAVLFDILTTVSVGRAVLVALLLLPFVGVAIGFLPSWAVLIWVRLTKGVGVELDTGGQAERAASSCYLFCFSIAFSFTVTLSALFIGHQFDSQAWVPQTQRLLWANALFDGATVVVSLYILERALPPRRSFSIPTAVGLDLLLGVIFACASLWLGVKRLAAQEVVRVLFAHSNDGQRWEVGPYFWAMHTVFLPLLIYLSVVMMCWVGKAIVAYREWFYGRAKDEEINGLNMTARFLAYVVAALTALIVLLRVFT